MRLRNLTTAVLVATLFVCSTIAPLAAHQSSQSMQNDNKMSDGMMKDNKMSATKMSNKTHVKHKRHANTRGRTCKVRKADRNEDHRRLPPNAFRKQQSMGLDMRPDRNHCKEEL